MEAECISGAIIGGVFGSCLQSWLCSSCLEATCTRNRTLCSRFPCPFHMVAPQKRQRLELEYDEALLSLLGDDSAIESGRKLTTESNCCVRQL